MSRRTRDTCCNVVERDCAAPAGLDVPASKLVTCYPCGRDVCRNCSAIETRAARGPKRSASENASTVATNGSVMSPSDRSVLDDRSTYD